MYNKGWFKFLAWSTAAFFFFLNSTVIIATLGPFPSEEQVHLWMSEMMNAMHFSLMAFSMHLEEDTRLMNIILASSQLIIPLAVGGFLSGLLVRLSQKKWRKDRYNDK